MDQIKQAKVGSALERLLCLYIYEHALEGGGNKDKVRADFRALPPEKRLSRAIFYSPGVRFALNAINAMIEGEWTPGDDAHEEIKTMAATLKARGIVGLLADEPAEYGIPLSEQGLHAPSPFSAPAASPFPAPASAPASAPLPAMTLPSFGAPAANPLAPAASTPAPAVPVLPPFPGFGG